MLITDAIREMLGETGKKARDIGKALVLFEPEPPYRGRGLLTVLVTSASLITIAILGGVSLAVLLVLLVCLSLIMLLLTRVMGVDITAAPEDIFGFRS
ncbi:hypothetical protein K8I61_10495 [bacterium]|nr:hypothetical protein [bacterium]